MQRSEFNPKLRPVTVAVLTALSMTPALSQAASPAPGAAVGNEFQVNTYTSSDQESPAIARDAAGDYVVVWQSNNQATTDSGYDIYAQRYAADGTPQGSEFLVNTTTSNNQRAPAVAMDAAGDFVVAWESINQVATDSNGDIYAQRYAADGTPQGSEFLVNTYTSGIQTAPAIAMDAAGEFVMAWASDGEDSDGYGVYAQRYASDGTSAGSEFQINTYASKNQTNPAIAMDAVGDFVVTWGSDGQDGNKYGVYAQRYTAAGTTQGTEFQVNTFTSGFQGTPSIAMDAAGDFTIAWQSKYEDGDNYGIFARRYAANGTALDSSEFQVNTFTSGSQEGPAIAMDAAGDFVVAWESYNQAATDSGYDIYAQRYATDGTPVGSEFLVNTYKSSNQENPAIAMDAAGDFVVGWKSLGQDGDGYGIYAQRYARSTALDLAATLTLAPTPSVSAGSSVTLTAGVNNTATASTLTGNATIDAAINTAFGVTAALTLPSDVTFKSASGSNWTCPSAPTGNVLTCTFAGTLAAASSSDQLTVTVTAPATTGALAFANAVAGDQPDSNSANDTTNASVTVTASSGSGSSGSSGASSSGGGALGLLSLIFVGLLSFTRRRK